MGYHTKFSGVIWFHSNVTVRMIEALNEMLQTPNWKIYIDPDKYDSASLNGFNLELTKDLMGLQWDGSEKARGLDTALAVIYDAMRFNWPTFIMEGTIRAQGEELDDKYLIHVCPDNRVFKEDLTFCEACGKEL